MRSITMSSGPDRRQWTARTIGKVHAAAQAKSFHEPQAHLVIPFGQRTSVDLVHLTDEVGHKQIGRLAVDLRAESRPVQITPWFITTIRSAMASASSWSWVTIMVVTPSLPLQFLDLMAQVDAHLGIQAQTAVHPAARGRATWSQWRAPSAIRCCWPPDSCAGYLRPLIRQTDQFQKFSARAFIDFRACCGLRVLQAEGNVLFYSEVRKQRIGLKHDTEIAL